MELHTRDLFLCVSLRLRFLDAVLFLGLFFRQRHAVIDDPSVQHPDDPCGILLGKLGVVGDHYHEPVGSDLLQYLHDHDTGLGIERPGRFVKKDDVGIIDEGSRDGDALHLSSGHLGRPLFELISEAHVLKCFLCPLSALLLLYA